MRHPPLTGYAQFDILNPNYEVLGSDGDLTYDWTIVSGPNVVESTTGWVHESGTFVRASPPLDAGTYTATITPSGFPEMADSSTFVIADCDLDPQLPPPPLSVYGVTMVCLPGDETEALLFVVDHPAAPHAVGWAIDDDQGHVVFVPEVHLPSPWSNEVSARHVPAGPYDLVVSSLVDPTATITTPIVIEPCAAPADPSDPPDASDPPDPANRDPSNPPDRQPTAGAGEPADPTDPTVAATPGIDPATGTLPPTAVAGVLPDPLTPDPEDSTGGDQAQISST